METVELPYGDYHSYDTPSREGACIMLVFSSYDYMPDYSVVEHYPDPKDWDVWLEARPPYIGVKRALLPVGSKIHIIMSADGKREYAIVPPSLARMLAEQARRS